MELQELQRMDLFAAPRMTKDSSSGFNLGDNMMS